MCQRLCPSNEPNADYDRSIASLHDCDSAVNVLNISPTTRNIPSYAPQKKYLNEKVKLPHNELLQPCPDCNTCLKIPQHGKI